MVALNPATSPTGNNFDIVFGLGVAYFSPRSRAASISQKTLVIVPTFNARANLTPLIERLMALPVPVYVLVVDDNSPDGTGDLADGIAKRNPQVHVLHRQV